MIEILRDFRYQDMPKLWGFGSIVCARPRRMYILNSRLPLITPSQSPAKLCLEAVQPGWPVLAAPRPVSSKVLQTLSNHQHDGPIFPIQL